MTLNANINSDTEVSVFTWYIFAATAAQQDFDHITQSNRLQARLRPDGHMNQQFDRTGK